MKVSSTTQLCMVIGKPIAHSLSPIIHNAGYEALHIDNQYVYVAAEISEDQIDAFLNSAQTLRIRGISCTAPLKNILFKKLKQFDAITRSIGAINTIVNDNDVLKGYNTDWIGITEPLKLYGSLEKKRVAIIGAGGAAKAAAFGISLNNAYITVFSRTLSKAKEITKVFGGRPYSLQAIYQAFDNDIIINTISDNLDYYLSDKDYIENIQHEHIIFDISYGKPSKLLVHANTKGASIITGYDMLLHQGMAQFLLFTGHQAPKEAMQSVLNPYIREMLGVKKV
jgi:shikimate dehydrogenase